MGSNSRAMASLIKPKEGVNPPTSSAAHNSIRSAPAAAAFFIDEINYSGLNEKQ